VVGIWYLILFLRLAREWPLKAPGQKSTHTTLEQLIVSHRSHILSSDRSYLHIDTALVCRDHVLDVDESVVSSLRLEQLESLHNQLA